MTTRETREMKPRKVETTLESGGRAACAVAATRTTNAQGVHTVSIALKTLPRGVTNAREVTFHWGVLREKTGRTWQVLPSELHPPNTEYYQGDKAMRSAFPVWGPVNLVLDPHAKSVAFALYVEKTGEWINAVGGENFEIELAAETATSGEASAVAAPEPTPKGEMLKPVPKATVDPTPRETTSALTDPIEILIANMARMEWEAAGRPSLDAQSRDDILRRAANQIKSELAKGMSLEQLAASNIRATDSQKRVPEPPKGAAKAVEKPVATKFSLEDFQAVARDRATDDTNVKWNKLYEEGGATIFMEAREVNGSGIQLHVLVDSKDDLIMHWGSTTTTDGSWKPPPHGFSTQPSRSWASSGSSWETELERVSSNLRAVTLDVPLDAHAREGIIFVLRTTSNKWIKNGREDFFASLEGPILERPAKKEKKEHHKESRHDQLRTESHSEPFVVKVAKKEKPAPITRERWDVDDIALDQGVFQNLSGFVAQDMIDKICGEESGATRSLMHRYNAGADMLGAMHSAGEPGLTALFCWFRFMALRQLVWNNDYNIKPREISAAQARMTEGLSAIYRQDPEYRDIVRLIMATIGRGGDGDVGQRIRDEILAVQQKNNCKGGMMEEWHQKFTR
jgi:alpha-glucan,water dikinase